MAVTQKSSNINRWQDPKAKPYIEIDNISKEYDGISALRHISLSIYEGEFFTLLGASGCGKTTLLRILGGFDRPTGGHILIDGINITDWPPYSRPVNTMFQNYALFPHMNVYDNIAFGLRFEKITKSEISERVYQAMQLVQMEDCINRKPNQLSGGQKQRVALARSLVKRPKLILLDEPLAALDKKLREQTQFELVNIQETVGITFIMVTHDQEEAMTMSSRIAIMREGEIVQIGMPHEIYECPNSCYTANFIGSVNIFEGIITKHHEDFIEMESQEISSTIQLCSSYALTAPIGAHINIAVRPEKMLMSKEKVNGDYNIIKGTVTEIAYIGDMSIYYIALPSGKIVQSSVPNLSRLSERDVTWDDSVYLYWKPTNGVVLTL